MERKGVVGGIFMDSNAIEIGKMMRYNSAASQQHSLLSVSAIIHTNNIIFEGFQCCLLEVVSDFLCHRSYSQLQENKLIFLRENIDFIGACCS